MTNPIPQETAPCVTFTVLCGGDGYMSSKFTQQARELGGFIGWSGYNYCHSGNGFLSGKVREGVLVNARTERPHVTTVMSLDEYSPESAAYFSDTDLVFSEQEKDDRIHTNATDIVVMYGGHNADKKLMTYLEQFYGNKDTAEKQLWLLDVDNSYAGTLKDIARMTDNHPTHKKPQLVTSASELKTRNNKMRPTS